MKPTPIKICVFVKLFAAFVDFGKHIASVAKNTQKAMACVSCWTTENIQSVIETDFNFSSHRRILNHPWKKRREALGEESPTDFHIHSAKSAAALNSHKKKKGEDNKKRQTD